MKDASRSERRGQNKRGEGESLFPAEGHFSPVVPLSESAVEAAHAGKPSASAETDEPEETTLVPPRVSPGPRPVHTSRGKQRGEQSWASLAVAVVLSLAAGAATGVYIFQRERSAETYHAGPPAEDVAAGEAAGRVVETEPADGPLTPRPSEPAPNDRDGLAPLPGTDVSPVVPEARAEAATKAERVNRSAQPQKTSPQAAVPPTPRAAQTETRGARPEREAVQASPAPRLTRANVGSPRAERNTPATVTQSERPALITSPPPSAKPKKVIQWP